NEFFRAARRLVASHLQNCVDRFLLGALDERAGINYDDVGVFSAPRQFGTGAGQHAHHHLAVDKVLGTAEADKTDSLRTHLGIPLILRRSFLIQLRGTADSEVLYWHAILLF